MIKTDRQYQITKRSLEDFERSLADLEKTEFPPSVDPRMKEVFRSSFESQRDQLAAEIQEYESLRSGAVTSFAIDSIAELPNVLIRARIARGFTQKDLAERLGLKEQQVQRWEANDYAGATIETLQKIAQALEIRTKKEVFLPTKISPKAFLEKLTKAGLPSDFTFKRLLPTSIVDVFKGPDQLHAGIAEVFDAANILSHVFGVSLTNLLQPDSSLDIRATAAPKFKMPVRAKASAVSLYTVYAHYLAACIATCFDAKPKKNLPTDWHQFFQAVTSKGKPMTFETVLNFTWDCGIAVLPLREAGGFHGAVWKIRNTPVIVLKQNTPLESRWLFDLLHELGHIANDHVTSDEAIIEDKPIKIGGRDNEEEIAANDWARDAVFDGEWDEIEDASVVASDGKVPNLKSCVPGVAEMFNVNAGCLANHLAYRLAEQGTNWWGAADNLQDSSANAFDIARRVLLKRVNLNHLSSLDRDLVLRGLSETE